MVSLNQIPEWLEHALSQEEAERIDAAVKAAERRTSAEIVPMIVRRSTLKATGDRILFWICFGCLGVTGAMGLSFLGGLDETILDRLIGSIGIWPTGRTHLALAMAIEMAVAGFAFFVSGLLAKWLSQFDVAHRLAFPISDQTLEAEHRAQAELYASDLRSTKSRTGVLLFVSLLERRAVILADDAILAKIGADRVDIWTDTLTRLLGAIRNGQMGQGYVDAIASITKLLEPQFPAGGTNENELSDGLRILE